MRKVLCVCVMVMSMLAVAPMSFSSTDSTGKGSVAAEMQTAVNINRASVDELQRIPEVGKTTAERIVAYREEQGPFKDPQDLVKIKGIGSKKFEKMKAYVVVE